MSKIYFQGTFGAWVVWKKNGQKSEETLYTEGSFESRKKY